MNFDKLNFYYKKNMWTKNQLRIAVDKKIITSQQFEYITGEAYD